MRKPDLDPELELKGWKAQRAKFEYEMLSVQEGISYELNYIKAHSMLRKSSDTHLFPQQKQSLLRDSELKKQCYTPQTKELLCIFRNK